jgi:L-fuconolactonase
LRIDAHHHVWDLTVRDQPWTEGMPVLRRNYEFGDLAPSLDAHGIDGTVLVQTIPVPEETPELLRLAAAEPAIAGVVGWADLRAPDIAEQIARLKVLPGGRALVGLRHPVQDEADPQWLNRPAARRGLAAVAAAGLVYDLLITTDHLPAATAAVRDLPQVRFVLDHGGKPGIADGALEPWATHIRALAVLPNAAVELSGLVTEADHGTWTVEQLRHYTDVIVEAFGPARVMFGSDWPVCLLAGPYDQVIDAARTVTAGLDDAGRTAVFGGTASEWYRLGTR